MFLMVVNEGDGVIGLADAINGHPRLAILGRWALENDVVDCLPVQVVHREGDWKGVAAANEMAKRSDPLEKIWGRNINKLRLQFW